MNSMSAAKSKKPASQHLSANKSLLLFSCILFAVILSIALTAYIIIARGINRSFIEQQLAIASDTMRLRLATTVNSELSLVMKMADTPVIRRHFLNPGDATLEKLAHDEFLLYQRHFKDKLVFWINDTDKIFYSTGNTPYVVDPDDPESYWYNMTLYRTEDYNLNINFNPDIQQINLWVNVPVTDDSEGVKTPIGMLGTGINLNDFSEFIASSFREFDRNITPFIFNKFGEITSAVDYQLVHNKVRLDDHLGTAGEELIRIAYTLSDDESILFIHSKNIYMMRSIPALEWYLTVSYPLPGVFALNQAMNIQFFSMLAVIFMLFVVMNIFVGRSENALVKQNMQLMEANRKAQIASQAKNQFMATMSHEIRTPMNAVIGLSEIELRSNLSESSRLNIAQIYQSGSSLLRIINDILDISKIEAGSFDIVPEEYESASLINDTISLNRVRIGTKPIDFVLSIDSDFPRMIRGDELRVKQILNNLLSNAIKYTKKGKVTLSISNENNAGNKDGEALVRVRFSVKDTGIGIRAEDMGKLFSSYTQLDAETTRKAEGTGLGLVIAKNLAEMMRGKISVESEYGKGSCFTAEIIQGLVDPTGIGEETAESLKSFHYTDDKKREEIIYSWIPHGKVLVVDDNLANLLVARGLFVPYGLQVETVASGQEAIDLIKTEKFDLIFMDHMMPGMDGVEAASAIREWEKQSGRTEVPIIALTANAMRGMKEYYLELGFNDYLSKPISPKLLDDLVIRWIGLTKNIGGLITGKGMAPVTPVQTEMEAQYIDMLNHYHESFRSAISDEKFDEVYLKKFSSLLELLCAGSLPAELKEKAALLRDAAGRREIRVIRKTLPAYYEALAKRRGNHLPGREGVFTEILSQLKKALKDGDLKTAGSVLSRLSGAKLDAKEREMYFLLYDLLYENNTEKACNALYFWERLKL